MRPPYASSSLEVKSAGITFKKWVEDPKSAFIQLLKKTVGAKRYSSTTKNKQRAGYKSKKKLKKRISATNIIDPGNPKKISRFTKLIRKSFGHKKFIPLISVISRVLNLRPMASTSKNEFVESSAWLISIQKLANISDD